MLFHIQSRYIEGMWVIIIDRAPCEPPAILSCNPELGYTPLSCGMVAWWHINSILANLGCKNSIWILDQWSLHMKYMNRSIDNLFYKGVIILEIKVALISYSLSKVAWNAVENNCLIAFISPTQPPAGSILVGVGYSMSKQMMATIANSSYWGQ